VGLIVLAGFVVLSIVVSVAGAVGLLSGLIRLMQARTTIVLMALAAMAPTVWATSPNSADQPIARFLSRQAQPHAYRATRRLEAENGTRHAWLDARTEYSPERGFRYQILAEGGSSQIRDRVLKAVLDGERNVIARGEDIRSALALNNYTFKPNGLDADGLANVLVSPRRKERALLSGVMFLRPEEGELVRLQGRLAKNPSFWVRDVDVVRKYARVRGVVVPVAMESTAHVRFLGPATFRMTYQYLEIDGRPITSE
jgi:hypothetical protein